MRCIRTPSVRSGWCSLKRGPIGPRWLLWPLLGFNAGDNGFKGDQIRGFGFLHDGSVDTLFRFHGATVFSTNNQDRLDLEAFVMAFDSNLAPIVGQQATLSAASGQDVHDRIDLRSQCLGNDASIERPGERSPRRLTRTPARR
jgi:hypothetical protein